MLQPLKILYFFNLTKYVLKQKTKIKNYNEIFYNTIKNYYSFYENNTSFSSLYSCKNIIDFCFLETKYKLL
jgi:hypothetical protein